MHNKYEQFASKYKIIKKVCSCFEIILKFFYDFSRAFTEISFSVVHFGVRVEWEGRR
jgi:hypothetical protein